MKLIGSHYFEKDETLLVLKGGESFMNQELLLFQNDNCIQYHLINFSQDVHQDQIATTASGAGGSSQQTYTPGLKSFNLTQEWEGSPNELNDKEKRKIINQCPIAKQFFTKQDI